MEPKKNPKADMSRRSTLFFQIGMIVMLLLAWQAIEWKTYDKSDLDTGMVDVGDELEEEVPITQQLTPPPPPPPPKSIRLTQLNPPAQVTHSYNPTHPIQLT